MRSFWLLLAVVCVAGCSTGKNGGSLPGGVDTGGGGGGGGTTVSPPSVSGGGAHVDVDAGTVEPMLGDKAVNHGQVPTNADALFAAASPSSEEAPTLAYPTAGTMFPPNIARILFQWNAAVGSVYQLRFETPAGVLDVYTDGVHETCAAGSPTGKCWESDAETLLPYLVASAGKTITLRIRSLTLGSPGTISESAPYRFHIAPGRVDGAIYYWSTTAQGIRRGTLDGRDAADYLTPPLAKDTCVACHTLSRSGKRMSVSFPGDLLGVVDVVETIPPPVTYGPPPFVGGQTPASWVTFSPDDSKLVVAGQGVLSVVSADDAVPVGPGVIPLPQGVYGTMPDWSPDGQHLVFTAIGGGEKARHLRSSSIAWLTAEGDSFSGYELIAESKAKTCGETFEAYANPMFSPDSQWLAFSHAACESENDSTSVIVLSRAQPSAEQFELVLANTQVGDQKLTNLQNGMPTWAPTLAHNIGWIAFTSTRDYGFVLQSDGTTGHSMRQLWVAAVDLSKVGAGDPSYPAFRLPAQDLDENNHRPFWAVDVLPPDWEPPVVK